MDYLPLGVTCQDSSSSSAVASGGMTLLFRHNCEAVDYSAYMIVEEVEPSVPPPKLEIRTEDSNRRICAQFENVIEELGRKLVRV